MSQSSLFYKTIHDAVQVPKKVQTIQSPQGAYLTIEGQKKLNLCSSHYLGFANDKRIKKAVIEAVEKYGVGTGYRTLAGTNVLHVELENAIARFKGTESAIVFTGGYMANLAAIQTILGKEDIVISDELNHASIVDAIRIAQIKNKFIYKHKDVKDLESKLQEVQKISKVPKENGQLPTILIVTDGVFSMDGDLAPLPEIVGLAEKYDTLTMVDDAHGEGVMGESGRGTIDHFDLLGKIDIEVGTLSKAFGVMGGFITGKAELIEYYKRNARQFMFSNTLTVPDTAAIIEAVKILEESDVLVKKLWENTKYLKEKLIELGFDCGHSQTPITPIMLGDEEIASQFSAKLLEEGVFATPIKFPMVPKGASRIRVIPSAIHSKEDLDFAIKIFKKVGKELKVI